MGLLDFFNVSPGFSGAVIDPAARKRRQQAAYEANVTGSTDPKLQERYKAEQRLGGLSEAGFGLMDLINTVANAGIRDVDYLTGGLLSGGTYDPYQLPMTSASVNTGAAEAREKLTGTKQVAHEEMPKDVQQQAANERGLLSMIPTGAEDIATSALPLSKAMFLGIKKTGSPQEAQDILAAMDELAKGTPPEEVWKKYNWAVDKPGRFAYTEISDLPMAFKQSALDDLNLGNRVTGKLGDIIDHPELFKAYPGLADVKVNLGLGKYGGEYNSNLNSIRGDAPNVYFDPASKDPNRRSLQQLLSHEIQHIIQRAEGWPTGSNLQAGAVTTPKIAGWEQTAKEVEKKRKEWYRIYTRKSGPEAIEAYKKWRDGGVILNDLEDNIRNGKAFEYYRRQPGEVQARNTETGRFGLTAQERLEQYPDTTADIPPSEQIKTYGTGFGKPRSPVLDVAAEEPGGVMGAVDQAVEAPAKPKKLTKKEREELELQQLAEEATKLFDMTATPNVPQTQIARYNPPKGVPQRILDLTSNPELRKMMLEKIEAGKQKGAHKWYNMEPLRLAFVDEFGDAEGTKRFNRYLDYFAGSSPKSTVPENLRNASYYYALDVKGEPLPEPYVNEKGKVIKNPEPYGHLAQDLHRSNFEKIRSGKGLDTKSNPKPLGFSEDLKGNLTPVAVDLHAFRLPAMLAKDERFLETSLKTDKGAKPRNIAKEYEEGKITMEEALREPTFWQSKPKETEYAAMERYYQELAREAGLEPGEGQAAAWVGGGPVTGLKSSEAETAMQSFIKRVAYTAQKRKLPVQKVLKDMLRGDNPLLALAGFGLLPLLYQMTGDREGGVMNTMREEG